MSETLYRCPCCGRLVPEEHFTPRFTKETILELSVHPILQKAMLRAAEQAVQKAFDERPQPRLARPGGRPVVREAPPGYLTYKQAVERGISYQTLRSCISQGVIKGSGGLVQLHSFNRFMETYTPRHRKK